MSRILEPAAIAAYENDGVLFPIPVLSESEVLKFRSALEAVEAHLGGKLKRMDWTHLFFRWAYDLAIHPAVVDAIAGILGSDIFVHSSRIFYKHPQDPSYVGWHQDGTYSGLNAYPALTAWIALSDSTIENGCLRVVSGAHRHGVYSHIETYASDNLSNHGEEVTIRIDETMIADVTLKAGQMSLHHINMIHGSNPNRSNSKRIGYSVTYITPQVRHSKFPVVVARGRDDYPQFEFLKNPPTENLEDSLAAHAEFLRRLREPDVRIG
jgi:ectoine hydroxylase-related dioxygenase (phytanoyl-CoA dioxygenase family)